MTEKKDDEDLLQKMEPFEPPPKADDASAPGAEQIAKLTAQIEEDRRLRVAAETRANAAVQEAHKAKMDAGDSQLQMVVTAIDTVESGQQALKGAYAEALRNGDFDAAAEIQASMADNAAKLLQLRNGKAAMESAPKPRAPEPIQTDPVEALASQLTPRSAAWVRAHPECVRDQRLYQKMIAAHNIVTADGIVADSDEYFQGVESILFKKAPAPKEDVGATEDPMRDAARRAAPPPAAPASRGQSNGRSLTLTAAQREAAEIAGQTPEEYANNIKLLRAEGRMQ